MGQLGYTIVRVHITFRLAQHILFFQVGINKKSVSIQKIVNIIQKKYEVLFYLSDSIIQLDIKDIQVNLGTSSVFE